MAVLSIADNPYGGQQIIRNINIENGMADKFTPTKKTTKMTNVLKIA